MPTTIISYEEALRLYLANKTVYFGTDVLNACFDTDGYSFKERDERAFNTIVSSFENSLDTTKPMQYAIK